jgi:hypothetical protein
MSDLSNTVTVFGATRLKPRSRGSSRNHGHTDRHSSQASILPSSLCDLLNVSVKVPPYVTQIPPYRKFTTTNHHHDTLDAAYLANLASCCHHYHVRLRLSRSAVLRAFPIFQSLFTPGRWGEFHTRVSRFASRPPRTLMFVDHATGCVTATSLIQPRDSHPPELEV